MMPQKHAAHSPLCARPWAMAQDDHPRLFFFGKTYGAMEAREAVYDA